jgi:uncharacterized protein
MVSILLIIIGLIVIIDLYAFKGLVLLFSKYKNKTGKRIFYGSYWLVTAILIMSIIYISVHRSSIRDPHVINNYFYLFGITMSIYISKIVFIVFHFIEDILVLIKWIYKKLLYRKINNEKKTDTSITRAKFLTQTGLVIASIPFTSLIYGMVKGRFNFNVKNEKLTFKNLPKGFNGLRIVQISDIHIGSFNGFKHEMKEAIELINAQKPDIILFTGDLINNYVEELDGWIEILSSMKARIGKYSILGNHDYGLYYHWNLEEERIENFRKLKVIEAQLGFKLLCNESITLSDKNNDRIALIGVENCGHPPFPCYADLKKASADITDVPFKILMSHDPMHWDDEVIGKTDIDLTLSGHTHGMQFGVHVGKFEWSPASLKYPRWGGLYREKSQFLYVNRGLGYIGYPGRVGMPPEITVIDLYCS